LPPWRWHPECQRSAGHTVWMDLPSVVTLLPPPCHPTRAARSEGGLRVLQLVHRQCTLLPRGYCGLHSSGRVDKRMYIVLNIVIDFVPIVFLAGVPHVCCCVAFSGAAGQPLLRSRRIQVPWRCLGPAYGGPACVPAGNSCLANSGTIQVCPAWAQHTGGLHAVAAPLPAPTSCPPHLWPCPARPCRR